MNLTRFTVLTAAVAALAGAGCVATGPQGFDYVGPRPAPDRAVDTGNAPTTAAALPAGPLKLTVADALLLTLQNNRTLAVERYTPAIRRTAETQAAAAFDPLLTAQTTATRTRAEQPPPDGTVAETLAGTAGVTQNLPTGTSVGVTAGASNSRYPATADQRDALTVGLTATQALLRGYGLDVNLASVRQARLDVRASEYELRGVVQAVVAQVEETYWDYILAQRQIAIVTESLALAQRQLTETQERIRLGKLAETETAAADAELARRQVDLINARSALAKTRVALLRLLSGDAALGDHELVLTDEPVVPAVALGDVADHLQLASRLRADLNQARLQVQRNDLELVKTKNGLLPKLDLFLNLGTSAYAESFDAAATHCNRENYSASVGLQLQYPLGNRAAEARHQQARYTRAQAAEALRNLAQLVEADVRTAFLEFDRARQQVAATTATRKLEEELVRVETEKFNVGKSTSLQVAQAQRDLLTSQLSEIQAAAAARKALVELFRLEGSLLEQRGLAAPGATPPPDLNNAPADGQAAPAKTQPNPPAGRP